MTTPETEDDVTPEPTPSEIVAQSLGQLAEYMQAAAEQEAFDEPNARNNALLASMAMVGLVPNLIASDYVEAQKCLAEIMSPLFDAMSIPRKQQPSFAAGMIGGIIEDKKPRIVEAGPMEISQYGKKLYSNGKKRRR